MNPPTALGRHSLTLPCPHCRQEINTVVKMEPSKKTHIFALLLCVVWLCCVPYCMASCKDRNHYCPNCKAYLGAHNP